MCAACKSHESIVCPCRDWVAKKIDRAIAYAAEKDHESIVRLCRDLGATDVDLAMVSAAYNAHVSIVRLSHDWGAEAFNAAMAHAARCGHIRIVILFHRWGRHRPRMGHDMCRRGESRTNRASVLHLGCYRLRMSRLTHIITINTIEEYALVTRMSVRRPSRGNRAYTKARRTTNLSMVTSLSKHFEGFPTSNFYGKSQRTQPRVEGFITR